MRVLLGAVVVITFGLTLRELASVNPRRIVAAEATMKSDLSRLAWAQREYRQKNGSYSSSSRSINGFTLSKGVSVRITLYADGRGWIAEATHSKTEDVVKCSIEQRLERSGGNVRHHGFPTCWVKGL